MLKDKYLNTKVNRTSSLLDLADVTEWLVSKNMWNYEKRKMKLYDVFLCSKNKQCPIMLGLHKDTFYLKLENFDSINISIYVYIAAVVRVFILNKTEVINQTCIA